MSDEGGGAGRRTSAPIWVRPDWRRGYARGCGTPSAKVQTRATHVGFPTLAKCRRAAGRRQGCRRLQRRVTAEPRTGARAGCLVAPTSGKVYIVAIGQGPEAPLCRH